MAIRSGILSLLLLLLPGCVGTGFVYTHVTEPATLDFHKTPVGSKRLLIRSFRVQEPVSGYGISAEWDADPVKAAARKAGVTNLFYADRQTLSILGLYRVRTLIVYGD